MYYTYWHMYIPIYIGFFFFFKGSKNKKRKNGTLCRILKSYKLRTLWSTQKFFSPFLQTYINFPLFTMPHFKNLLLSQWFMHPIKTNFPLERKKKLKLYKGICNIVQALRPLYWVIDKCLDKLLWKPDFLASFSM